MIRWCRMFVLAVAVPAWAGETITLHFEERPPYLRATDSGVHGITADLAAKAFNHAGIPFNWEQTSMNRQVHLLKENSSMHCVVGWFKTAERASFAKYTAPIFQDKPVVALVRTDFTLPHKASLESVLSLPLLRVVVKSNYSYGPYVDGLLARHQDVLISSQQPNSQITELVRGRRADLMFVGGMEAEELERNGNGLRAVRFPDVLQGESRHIVCARRVSDETIARLNKAIGGAATMP